MQRILIAPCHVEEFRLEEANEACPGMVEECTSLICFEEIIPVATALLVLLLVSSLAQASSHSGYAKVVVAVLKSPGDRSGHRAETLVVEILDRNIAESLPAVQSSSTFAAPI